MRVTMVTNTSNQGEDAAASSSSSDYADDEDYEGEEEVPPGTVPVVTSAPSQLVVDEGKTVELPCQGEHLRYFAILWKKGDAYLTNNEIVVSNDGRFRVDNKQGGNILVVQNVTSGDNGEYQCTVQDAQKILASVTHRLTVKEMPRAWTQQTKVVKANEPVTIHCNVTGYPKPRVFWQRKGKRMPNGDILVEAETITFNTVTRHHAGIYECVANNSLGQAITALSLDVMHAPEIELERESVNSGIRAEAELVCVVHAQPKAQVAWYKDGKTVQALGSSKYRVVPKGSHHWTLHIASVNEGDFGKYTCVANNSLGRDQKLIELSGAPSQPVLKESRIGKDLMSYTLIWTLESADKVDAFKIRYRRIGGDWKEQDLVGELLQPNVYTVSHLLQDLSPSADYEATLLAHNTFGWSKEAVPRRFHLSGEFQSLEADDEVSKSKSKDAAGSSSGPSSSPIFITSLLVALQFLMRRSWSWELH